MAIQEIRTFEIDCEDQGHCDANRTITVQGADEDAAARKAEEQGWAAQPPSFEGDDATFLCPEHFAANWPQWKELGYHPWWVKHHPALPTQKTDGNAK